MAGEVPLRIKIGMVVLGTCFNYYRLKIQGLTKAKIHSGTFISDKNR